MSRLGLSLATVGAMLLATAAGTQVLALGVSPPGAPTAVTAVPGDGSATVHWEAPSSDGKATIQSYSVTASPGGETQLAAGTARTAIVTGLPNGTAQTFSVAATNSAGTGPSSAASQAATPQPPGGQYQAVFPYRICDTRADNPSALAGLDLSQCQGRTLGPGGTLTVQVTGTDPAGESLGGVPATGVSAVALNVTATDTSAASFLTVWPAGSARPTASNLNWTSGQTVANLVTVAVGATGAVSFFNYTGRADIVVDVAGYVLDPAGGAAGLFTAVNPYRICDTRPGNPSDLAGTDLTQCQGRSLEQGNVLTIQAAGTEPTGALTGGVPSLGVAAVELTVTATDTSASSYLTVWPAEGPRPVASQLNWRAGQTVSNRVIVPVGAIGQVSFYSAAGTADLVVDIGGWFSDGTGASASGSYLSAGPIARICDTRSPNGSHLTGTALSQCQGKTLGPGGTLTIQVAGLGPAPAPGSQTPPTAAVLNVTATGSSAASYLTAWPTGSARPTASDLNWTRDQTVAGEIVVQLNPAGQVSFYNAAGLVNLVVDLDGFLAGEVINNPFPFVRSGLIDPLNGLSALNCAADNFCVAVDPSGNAATWNGGAWTSPQLIDPTGAGITAVACPSASFCIAVDDQGNAVAWNGSAWGQPQLIDPDSFLTGVSCASATFCAAVDGSGNALIWNGSSWTQPQSIDFQGNYLTGVSCPATTFCVAVDGAGDAMTWNGSSWSLPEGVDPVVGGLNAVSCASESFCVGVDGVGNEVTWSAGTWSTPQAIEPNNSLYSISCPATTFCVAVDGNGNALELVNGNWGAPQAIDPYGGGLIAVSCPTSSFCLAADLDGSTVVLSGGSWAPPRAVDPSGGGLTAVSCPAVDFCMAVDNAGNALTWGGSSWGQPQAVDPGGGGLSDVACPTASFCVAVDRHGDALVWTGASWAEPAAVDPAGGGLDAVSCASDSFCVAVDGVGDAVTLNGAGWSTPQAIDPGSGLTAVACSTASFCVAVDANGEAVALQGQSWGPPQRVDSRSGLTGVACPNATFCVAVDGLGNVATLTQEGWSQPQAIDPAGEGLTSVSCPSTTFCVAVDATGSALTWNGSQWVGPQAIDPFGGGLAGVSCGSDSFCAAVDAIGYALT